MKKTKTILTMAFLLLVATSIKAQEMTIITVYNDGNILYQTNLTTSDSIKFSKYGVAESDWVEINGIKWAVSNVNAPGTFTENPWDAGMLYQWNRMIGWSVTNPRINNEGGSTWDDTFPTGSTWETANDPCPAGWRVPTETELQSLKASNGYQGVLNDVEGCFFGSGEERLFFPKPGFRSQGGEIVYPGSTGYYWSNTATATGDQATIHTLLLQNALGIIVTPSQRNAAMSVRCVLSEP